MPSNPAVPHRPVRQQHRRSPCSLLLYARFWHKVLYDYGVTGPAPEPFGKLFDLGYLLADTFPGAAASTWQPPS